VRKFKKVAKTKSGVPTKYLSGAMSTWRGELRRNLRGIA